MDLADGTLNGYGGVARRRGLGQGYPRVLELRVGGEVVDPS